MTDDEILKAVENAIEKKVGAFYIDQERHYNEHNFIKELMDWADTTKGAVWKVIVKTVVLAILGAILIGFAFAFGKGGH